MIAAAVAVGELLQSSDPVAIAVGFVGAIVATIHVLVSVTISCGCCSVTVSDDDSYYFRSVDVENVGDEDLSIPYVAVLCHEGGYGPKIQGSISCKVDQGEGGCDCDGQEPEVMMNKVEEDRMMVKEDVEELAGMSWMKKGEVSVLTGYELRADDVVDDDD